jgi:hypothetical protein
MVTRNETHSAPDGRKKPQKQADFVVARLIQPSVEAAAKAAKISRATAFRYLRDPNVLMRLREASYNAMQLAAALGQAGAVEAVERLRWLASNAESESVQALSAKALLDFGFKTAEIGYILERLDALEKIARSRDWKGNNNDRDGQTQAEGNRATNGHGC